MDRLRHERTMKDKERGKSMIRVDMVYTIDGLAEAVDRSPRTIRRWIHDNGLPHKKVKGTILISGYDLARWIEGRKNVND